MIFLFIKNRYTQVTTSPTETRLVRDTLTFQVPNYQFSRAYREGRWDGKTSFLKGNLFPTGLVGYLMRNLPPGVRVKCFDLREKPDITIQPPCLLGIKLRPYQEQAVRKAVKAGRGIISAPPGAGKTEIALGIISSLSIPKTLYLVNTKELLYQTARRIKKRLDITPAIIGAGKYSLGKIIVASVASLSRHLSEMRTLLSNVELMIIDECHHTPAKTWYKVALECPAYFRFGLSATPLLRSTVDNLKLVATTGGVIERLSISALAEEGYLILPHVLIIPVNSKLYLPKNLPYSEVYEHGIVHNSVRNRIIAQVAYKLASCGLPTLVLVNRIQHGELLAEQLSAPFITGSLPSHEREDIISTFKRSTRKLLIATSVFDEGVDIPEIQAMVLAGGGKSPTKCIQRVGRGMRPSEEQKYSIVIDFIDRSSPLLYKHSFLRYRLYKEEGFQVKVVRTLQEITAEAKGALK